MIAIFKNDLPNNQSLTSVCPLKKVPKIIATNKEYVNVNITSYTAFCEPYAQCFVPYSQPSNEQGNVTGPGGQIRFNDPSIFAPIQ